MSDKLSLQSTIKQSQAVFAQAVDQDLIMLHVNQGKYFASNIVAQQIWKQIKTPSSIQNIVDNLLEIFEDINRETCETETLAFLETMLEANLVEVVNG